MNWYKRSQKQTVEDAIVWKCPITGIIIKAPRINGSIVEYGLYAGDGSWVDVFDTWYDANKVAKEIDPKANISKTGKLKK